MSYLKRLTETHMVPKSDHLMKYVELKKLERLIFALFGQWKLYCILAFLSASVAAGVAMTRILLPYIVAI